MVTPHSNLNSKAPLQLHGKVRQVEGSKETSTKQQAMTNKQQAMLSAVFLSLVFYPGYQPLGWVAFRSLILHHIPSPSISHTDPATSENSYLYPHGTLGGHLDTSQKIHWLNKLIQNTSARKCFFEKPGGGYSLELKLGCDVMMLNFLVATGMMIENLEVRL